MGNPLRGDDGVAWRVAERLERMPSMRHVVAVHQLTPELALTLKSASGIVFVDARRGEPAGQVLSEALIAAAEPQPFTQALTPAALLAYLHALYGTLPLAALVSIVAGAVSFEPDLSPAVRRAVPAAVRQVRSWIKSWSQAGTACISAARANPNHPHA